jgi:hypothetical protein
VSLWYIVCGEASTVITWDEQEFSGIRWVRPEQILDEPVETLDPHLHRFTRKLLASLPKADASWKRNVDGRPRQGGVVVDPDTVGAAHDGDHFAGRPRPR